jgi:hypothetical protein
MELLVFQADLIVVAGGFGPLEKVALQSGRGMELPYVSAKLRVARSLKPSSAPPANLTVAVARYGQQEPAAIQKELAPEQLWLLRKVPGRDLYRADAPGRRLTLDQFEEVAATLSELEKSQSWGPPHDGLRACAAVLPKPGSASKDKQTLVFAIANASNHPLRVCTHSDRARLRILNAADGNPLPVGLYKWLKLARLRPLTASDFQQIDPGQLLVLNEYGGKLAELGQSPTALSRMARQVRIELVVSTEAGDSKFDLKNVWTGTVSSGPVSLVTTKPASSCPSR